MTKAELWWNGPSWLSDPSQWPADIVTKGTDDSNAEKKVQRELFVLSVEANNDFDIILKKFGLRKAMSICTWISRFIRSSSYLSASIVRAVKLRAGRRFMERPIQHLDPLELSCHRNLATRKDPPLNPTAVEFRPARPRRDTSRDFKQITTATATKNVEKQ